jgi:hypothetical protein
MGPQKRNLFKEHAMATTMLFRNSFTQPKWRSSIGRYKKEKGDHPKEDLAKSGYEPHGPNMKHKSLINHHSIFLATY